MKLRWAFACGRRKDKLAVPQLVAGTPLALQAVSQHYSYNKRPSLTKQFTPLPISENLIEVNSLQSKIAVISCATVHQSRAPGKKAYDSRSAGQW
jgi:hypothetical protein